MLSAKRLVLDFKSRNDQGPPRDRVSPEINDERRKSLSLGQHDSA